MTAHGAIRRALLRLNLCYSAKVGSAHRLRNIVFSRRSVFNFPTKAVSRQAV